VLGQSLGVALRAQRLSRRTPADASHQHQGHGLRDQRVGGVDALIASWAVHRRAVTSPFISTTSRSFAVTRLSCRSASAFQRMSWPPLTNKSPPLSARNIPYFFKATRMTLTSGAKPEMS